MNTRNTTENKMDRTNSNSSQFHSSDNLPEPKSKSNKKTIFWVVLIIALLAIVCFIAFQFGVYKQRQEVYTEEIAYPADSVFVNGWASQEDYAYWKNAVFTIPEYNDIPVPFQRAIVKIFMDNKFMQNEDNNQYFFTKIKDRAPKVIAYGNFTGQGDKEMAFLLEKQDFASSAIFIITDQGNLLYWKDLSSELPTIKQFAKGALIYLNDMKLVPAPTDGIIKQNKNSKYVLIYNRETKTFDEHYQYTDEDVKNSKQEMEGDEETVEEVDTAVVE